MLVIKITEVFLKEGMSKTWKIRTSYNLTNLISFKNCLISFKH